jgi:hypothetical protein
MTWIKAGRAAAVSRVRALPATAPFAARRRKPRFKSTQELVLTALDVRIHRGAGEIALSLAGGRAAADR